MATNEGAIVVGHHHETEEEKRREHLDSLTADTEVRAPGMKQRIKEEVQAVIQSIYDKLCMPKKEKNQDMIKWRLNKLFRPQNK